MYIFQNSHRNRQSREEIFNMKLVWLRKPNWLVPPKLEKVEYLGPDGHNIAFYWFQLKVSSTIKAEVQCNQHRRRLKVIVKTTLNVPINAVGLAFGSVLPAFWLKALWWTAQGTNAINKVLKNERSIEKKIKALVEKDNRVCTGSIGNNSEVSIEVTVPEVLWVKPGFTGLMNGAPGLTL